MSKWDKLLEKVYSLSKDLRFDELKKILEAYGYTMKGTSGGSRHYTFRKKGAPPITIPKSNPIKRAYIELVKEAIEKEDANK